MKNPLPSFLQVASIRRDSGFALIATVLLMVLLTILAWGMLSLSAISLRTSSQASSMSEARSHARLALMLAIGELQEHTGADTRVTAPADIIDADAPPLTGAWKSWEGTNHNSEGRPVAPDYESPKWKDSGPGDRFLAWLVSGSETSSEPASLVFNASNKPSDSVPLLGEGTLGANDGQIHLKPQLVDDDSGAFAWWVSPENQKARLAQPHDVRSDDPAGWVEAGQSHSIPNPEVFGLAGLLGDPEKFIPDSATPKSASRAFSLPTAALLPEAATSNPPESFHDLSTSAIGLLTNTATGGWRKDLSLLTEEWDDIYASYPGGRLPLFRFSPTLGDTSQVPKPTTSNYDPEQANLYPWSEYSTILGYKQPGTYHAASASWASLQSFATSHKNFSYSAGSVTSPFVWDKIAKQRANQITSSEIYNHKHRQLLHPQIARFQFLVYVRAVPREADPTRYEMWLKYVPVFTLWNPYNVTLEHEISGTENAGQGSGKHPNFLGFGWRRAVPGALAIERQDQYLNPDSVPASRYRLLTNGNFQTLDWPSNYANPYDNNLPGNLAKFGSRSVWKDARTWGCWLAEGTITFKPGEAKVFSPDFIDPGYGFGGTAMRMKEGYNPTSIVGPEFRIKSNEPADRRYWFLYRPDRLTQPYRDREPGAGFSLSFGNGGSHFGGTSQVPSGIGEEYHNITALAPDAQGNVYWPPDEVDEVGYTVAALEGQWVPLFSVSFGPRMTIGTGPGTKQNRPTKGTLQNDALAGMVLSDPASGSAKDHPANNTFDFSYHSLSIGSTITPNLSNSKGYIATGYQSGDGLSRLIVSEIPLRPMASLVELQGWNPRGHNPYPPFQMNLIGNSDATPLIPKDGIVPYTLEPAAVEHNLMHDDAYCANHMLFDDWFVSSIAAQPQGLGGPTAKDIKTFYRDVLTGDDRLSNRSYYPVAGDANLSATEATERAGEIIDSPEGFLKVASRLEVAGMFNVNSTSVEAWTALLGHAKSRDEVGLYGENGMESVNPSSDHPVTRGAVAPDVEAGSGPAIGGVALNAAEYTGFRSLTDVQIEDLAEKIVEQVRARGPFLSLSEFVNRQLSSDEDLALAGAVQTAIHNLSDDPMEELRNPASSLSDVTMHEADPNDPKLDGTNYAFDKAAEGDSAYGVPGWIRQADILRPIAPVLSARDDTFTVRAYGDSRDADGNVVARVWCEAVVRRTRDFCDVSDPADSVDPPQVSTNKLFGRRYEIISFRWLNQDEV